MEETDCDPRCWKCLTSCHITALSFHPIQSDRFVSGGLDKIVRSWRLDKGGEYNKVRVHRAEIFDVCYSPNGDLIASASGDNTVRVRFSEGRHYFSEFRAHRSAVRSVQFSPKGDKLVSASDDNYINLWTSFLGQYFNTFSGHTSCVRCVRFSPDGKLLISCSDDKTIKVWDVNSERCIKTFGDAKADRYVEFHPTGTIIGSANLRGCVKLYDLRTDSLYQHYAVHKAAVNMIKFHPNGNFILTASTDSTMKIIDLLEGRPIYTLTGHCGSISCIAFSNDGKHFVSSGPDQRLRIWKSNNLCTDGRTKEIPQLMSSVSIDEQELDDAKEKLNSGKCEEDIYEKELRDFQAQYLSKGNVKKSRRRRLSIQLMKPEVINMKNIKPLQGSCIESVLTAVPQNQASSNSSNQSIETVDQILDKVKSLRLKYNILEQHLIKIEEALVNHLQ